MNCPVDGNRLQVGHRQGIEIDWCPECRGLWLDRGELDKLIERSYSHQRPVPLPGYHRPRKKNWLSELFDD